MKDYKHYVGTTHDYSNGGNKESSWCAKMLEKEGAILVGTLTMHELGMGKRHSPSCGYEQLAKQTQIQPTTTLTGVHHEIHTTAPTTPEALQAAPHQP